MQETQEMWARSLGWEDPPEKEMATHSSIVAWKTPWTIYSLPGSSVHGIFPGKKTGVGSHSLLQGIFSTQGSNPHLLCLLHCKQIPYLLSHQWSPKEKLAHSKQRLHKDFLFGKKKRHNIVCETWKNPEQIFEVVSCIIMNSADFYFISQLRWRLLNCWFCFKFICWK